LLAVFALRPAFPDSETGRHARDYYETSAPPAPRSATDPARSTCWRHEQRARPWWFPRSPCDRSVREAPSSTPAASPRLRRRLSSWPPHRWS